MTQQLTLPAQGSAMCRLVSFQSDWSWANVALFLASCCLLGSRVLLGKGMCEAESGMHSHSREAGFTWLWWIQGTISTALTAVRGWIKQQQKGPSSGALVVEHSIPLPKQHPLVYKGVWELSG
jgi:hypothetical protein